MEPTDYCFAALDDGTQANERVLSGLRAYGFGNVHALETLTVAPHERARALRGRRTFGPDVCVKFYDLSPTARQENGLDGLRRSARALRALRGVAPVPEIVGVEEDASLFGLPALITTFAGDRLPQVIGDIDGPARMKLADDIADVAAALTRIDPHDVGVPRTDLAAISDQFTTMLDREVEWYSHWLETAGASVTDEVRELVVRSNRVFATNRPRRSLTSLIHRDPTEGNIAVGDGVLSAFVDWDKITALAPQEDLGKLIASFLLLPISEDQRLEMVRRLLARYHSATGFSAAETFEPSLIQALSYLLHQLVVYSRAEVIWPVSVILDELDVGSPAKSNLWSAVA
jgi:aminoglycoside phosphotransferase (APT) family kinase protein